MPERDSRFCHAGKSFPATRRDTRNREQNICGLGDPKGKSTNLPARTAQPTDSPEEIVRRCRSAAKRLSIWCQSPYAAAQSLGNHCEFPKADWAEKSKMRLPGPAKFRRAQIVCARE